jgi:Uma2 family endonuclease
MATLSRKLSTAEELLTHANADRCEIVAGELVEKAAPSPGHSFAAAKLVGEIHPYNRRPGRRGPGGWWVFTEIHVAYPRGERYCHDLAGWRRTRLDLRPREWPVRVRPDWVCEIVSPKHERNDLIVKPRVLHGVEVLHYWVVDPEELLLLVHRWSPDGYTVVQRATAGETLRAEPFDAIDLAVSALFGDDEDEY